MQEADDKKKADLRAKKAAEQEEIRAKKAAELEEKRRLAEIERNKPKIGDANWVFDPDYKVNPGPPLPLFGVFVRPVYSVRVRRRACCVAWKRQRQRQRLRDSETEKERDRETERQREYSWCVAIRPAGLCRLWIHVHK